jgi:hypothetical protein
MSYKWDFGKILLASLGIIQVRETLARPVFPRFSVQYRYERCGTKLMRTVAAAHIV